MKFMEKSLNLRLFLILVVVGLMILAFLKIHSIGLTDVFSVVTDVATDQREVLSLNGEKNVFCLSNDECHKNEYCNRDVSRTGYSHSQSPEKGFCRSNAFLSASDGWISSEKYMDWWSVEAFCASHGKQRVTRRDLGCSDRVGHGACDTEKVRRLYETLQIYYVWTADKYDAENAFNVDLSSGMVNYDYLDNSGRALCR